MESQENCQSSVLSTIYMLAVILTRNGLLSSWFITSQMIITSVHMSSNDCTHAIRVELSQSNWFSVKAQITCGILMAFLTVL